MPESDEVELGWIKVTKVLSTDTQAGVDVDVEHSDDLAVLDAIGMLAAAQQIVWENAEDDE